jgi:hypothetical protein
MQGFGQWGHRVLETLPGQMLDHRADKGFPLAGGQKTPVIVKKPPPQAVVRVIQRTKGISPLPATAAERIREMRKNR